MENRTTAVDQALNKAMRERIESNREKLSPIVKTVVFCGRQNIPLRGHRDDSAHYENSECGNFQALLDFRVESGDKVLQKHFETAPRNATYRSKTIQNELISCCGEVITEKIVKEIKDSKFYAISADEVQDCSNKEQMPLVIRYVNKEKSIQEKFIRYILCDKGLTGEALSEKIKENIAEIGLDLQDCRGQCYDGAGNMAGKCSGAAARILNENSLALYTHCASHRLNLCVAASCNLQNVKNMMDNVRVKSDFFNNSPKRQQLLEQMIKEHLPQENHSKLIDVCRTRWVLRLDGLDRFVEMYTPIVEALFTIRDNVDKKWDSCAATAYSLAAMCCDFDFIITLIVVKNILAYTRSATVKLQRTEMDIAKAYSEINVLIKSIQKVRDSVEIYHRNWYDHACSIAKTVDATVKKPRTASRQQHRSNLPAIDASSYYRINVVVPFLDHLLNEMNTRFSTANCSAVKGFSIIPSNVKASSESRPKVGNKRKYDDVFVPEDGKAPPNSGSSTSTFSSNDELSKKCQPASDSDINMQGNDSTENRPTVPKSTRQLQSLNPIQIQRMDQEWKKDFKTFCSFYANDFPNKNMISVEVDLWETYWLEHYKGKMPSTIAETLPQVDELTFPNIYTALKILGVLPVTSCTCERSASTLRHLKTYMRSTMSQDRMNGLASIYTHRNIEIDIEKVIDKFARKHKTRLELIDILSTDKLPLEQNLVQ